MLSVSQLPHLPYLRDDSPHTCHLDEEEEEEEAFGVHVVIKQASSPAHPTKGKRFPRFNSRLLMGASFEPDLDNPNATEKSSLIAPRLREDTFIATIQSQ